MLLDLQPALALRKLEIACSFSAHLWGAHSRGFPPPNSPLLRSSPLSCSRQGGAGTSLYLFQTPSASHPSLFPRCGKSAVTHLCTQVIFRATRVQVPSLVAEAMELGKGRCLQWIGGEGQGYIGTAFREPLPKSPSAPCTRALSVFSQISSFSCRHFQGVVVGGEQCRFGEPTHIHPHRPLALGHRGTFGFGSA